MIDFIPGDKVYLLSHSNWLTCTCIGVKKNKEPIFAFSEKGYSYNESSAEAKAIINTFYGKDSKEIKKKRFGSITDKQIAYRYRKNSDSIGVVHYNHECKFTPNISINDFLHMSHAEQQEEVDTVKEDKLTQIMQGLKGDAINAGYRVGSVQLTNAVKAAVVAVLQKQGSDGGTIAQVGSFLDSDVGAAMISMTLAFALPQLPENISSNPHIEKLSTELQINSMTTVGNLVMDEVSGHVMPALNAIFENLPKEEEEQEVVNVSRVRRSLAPVEEEEAPVEYTPLIAEK